jgi:hypothetical protein
MKKTIIPRDVFFSEFSRYKDQRGYKTLFSKELEVEPVQGIVAVHGARLKDFRQMLKILEYCNHPLLLWRRGEDARAVKDYGEKALRLFRTLRRHLKIWDVTGHSGFLFTTAHNEDGPGKLFVPKETGDVLHYHLMTKGKGDYESGTRDFYAELGTMIS